MGNQVANVFCRCGGSLHHCSKESVGMAIRKNNIGKFLLNKQAVATRCLNTICVIPFLCANEKSNFIFIIFFINDQG